MMSDAVVRIPRDSSYSNQLADRLTQFSQQHKFTDCRIIVAAETIDCHANVVSAFSPVFERMMETSMAEGQTREVTFRSVQPAVMKAMLHFMYTGDVHVQRVDVVDLLHGCDFLQVLELRDKIVQEIPKLLSPDTVIGWWLTAHLLHLDDIVLRCKGLMVQSFKQVANGAEFAEMNPAELKHCMEVVKEDISSNELLRNVFSWVSFDNDTRAHSLDDLLKCISLETCSQRVLGEILEQYAEILDQNRSVCQLIRTMLQRKSPPPLYTAAISAVLSLVVVGGRFNKKCWSLDSDGEFQETAQIPDNMFSTCHSLCAYDKTGLILTGGLQKTVCAIYNFMSAKWQKLTDLPITRHYHASVCIFGELFVIGGKIPGEFEQSAQWTSDVQCLNTEMEGAKWHPISRMPFVLAFPKAARIDGSIFLMGNSNPKLFNFDVEQGVWNQLSRMPQNPGSGFGIAAGDTKIFAAGGECCICFMYDLASDDWSELCKPSLVHSYGALAFHQNHLVLLGGDSPDVEEYDAEQETWRVASYKLPRDLDFHFAFSMQ